MCLKFCNTIYIFTILSANLLSLSRTLPNQNGSDNSSQRSLKVDRATATTLMLEVPCKPHSKELVSWGYKINDASEWISPDNVLKHPAFDDTYQLRNLQPDTEYYLRAVWNTSKSYTSFITTRTCPAQAPAVDSLHVATAGAGWLEVRWRPPKELCRSQIKYTVRYKADGSQFTPPRAHGVFLENARYLRFRPAHPCPVWPQLFCLLLTDNVEPGKNHTVEVQVVRVDNATTHDLSAVKTTYGFANSSKYDYSSLLALPIDANAAPPHRCQSNVPEGMAGNAVAEKKQSDFDESTTSLTLPFWAAVLGWAVVAFLIAVILLISITNRSCSTRKTTNNIQAAPYQHGNEIVFPLTLQVDVSVPAHIHNSANNNNMGRKVISERYI